MHEGPNNVTSSRYTFEEEKELLISDIDGFVDYINTVEDDQIDEQTTKKFILDDKMDEECCSSDLLEQSQMVR